MPTFFYTIRKAEDGVNPYVEFYADEESASLACEVAARKGLAMGDNKPQQIELAFDAKQGRLITPDFTATELREMLKQLEPVKAQPPASVAEKFTREARAERQPPQPAAVDPTAGITSLAGKTIVFTGKMSMSRPRLKEYAKQLGVTIATYVTETTDLVVQGEETGSMKMEQAGEYGTKVITEAQWLKLAERCEKTATPSAPKL
ncbi:MAG: BRCT domain-containing protein [Alphaproteobacteria bacterium]